MGYEVSKPKTMKSIIYVTFLTAVIAACQLKTITAPTDRVAVKQEVASLIDKYHAAIMAKDAKAVILLIDEESLICGTDPEELLTKEQFYNKMSQGFANPNLKLDYSISHRDINIAPDGYSAIVMDQFFNAVISEKTMLRQVFYVVKRGREWKVSFLSLSFIPKNSGAPK